MDIRHRSENKSTNDDTLIDDRSSTCSSLSESEHEQSTDGDWRQDKWNIGLLLLLYLLQGVPLGMAASIPLIIQTYGAFWPFSLKLLWAPIVDAWYSKRFGRRKTWLIPVQYSIAFVMILLSYYINDIIMVPVSSTNSSHPSTCVSCLSSLVFFTIVYMFDFLDILFLTSIFFGLSFLAATQDICVDGWALSMLTR
jgi:MFS transporter, PAT family, solute carrier family 33 (acetyl-CoA transportor), member 1